MAEGRRENRTQDGTRAVFLSYASEDSAAAGRLCEALRAAGIEVWFDQSDLRGGDAWDQKIRREIRDCALFIPVISANTQARLEGYFRREWKLAASRTHDMADDKPFLVPVVIDATRDEDARVPEPFRAVQWTSIPAEEISAAFVHRILHLLSLDPTAPASAGGAFGASLALSAHPGVTARHALLEKSVAVLPFADMSALKDQEYFADGIAEGIRDQLARIPAIKVVGRSSSCQFKGKNEDLREIGSKLGVAYVLEGSVRKSGGRVRVTAQLIDVRDGSHRWAESYDRDLIDVLKVQDEISIGLVRELQVSMGADQPGSSPSLRSVEGYSLYLRGRLAFNRYDKQGNDQAASYFRQAMSLDPDSALASAWLAYVYWHQASYGFVPPDPAFEDARHYAERALSLDPRSELAIAVLGLVHLRRDWDWAAGAAELDRALALAPGNARILDIHCIAELSLGDWDAAIRDVSASLAIDPLLPAAHNLLGIIHLAAGHWSNAEAAFTRALEIAPHYVVVRSFLAKTLLLKGEKHAALEQIDLEADEAARWGGRAAIFHALGESVDSDAALKRLTELESPLLAFRIACVHAYRGDSDAAFVWLEQAFMRKDPGLWRIKSEPYLNSLKGDPRYGAILRKMNLPE